MSRYHRRLGRVVYVPLLGLAAVCLGCGVLDHAARIVNDCTSTPVTLLNSQQTLGPIHLVGPDEVPGPGDRLSSGAARELWLCLSEGRSFEFRAIDDGGAVVGTAKCAASRDDYLGANARVVWTPGGLRCENW